jgi:hypothetical protein
MKMDAMQKRKTWKVISYHFSFTMLIYLLFFIFQPARPMILDVSAPKEWVFIVRWPLLALLQPIACKFFQPDGFFFFILMPVWSICFGWLFVKLDNWLNHFPVLGKKVFSNRKS